MIESVAIAAAALLAVGPLAICATRLARRHRRIAFAATSLLLIFGLSVTIDPPPPPRIEAVQREARAAEDDGPE